MSFHVDGQYNLKTVNSVCMERYPRSKKFNPKNNQNIYNSLSDGHQNTIKMINSDTEFFQIVNSIPIQFHL